MKYKRLSLILLTISAALLPAGFMHQVSAAAAATPKPATESADIDPEMIKENIKKRIQEVIKNQTLMNEKKTAYNGTVTTITTNSISLETTQGVQQASTSATLTKYIDLTSNKEVDVDEISIGDYVSALGFLPDNGKVLDTRRVLVLRTPPTVPKVSAIYGRITAIDKKKNSITVANEKLQLTRTLTNSSKSEYMIADSYNHKQIFVFKNLAVDNQVLALYTPDSNDESIGKLVNLTIRSSTELTLQPSVSPVPSPSPTPNVSPKPKAQ